LRQKPNSAAYTPKEAQATDVVGFGSRRETASQRGPERDLSRQNLDNQRSLGTDAFAASDRVTFRDWENPSGGKGHQQVSSDTVVVLEESGTDLTNEQQGVRSRQKTMSEGIASLGLEPSHEARDQGLVNRIATGSEIWKVMV